MAKDCHKQFSVKTGSVFEDSPIPLDKWLTAVWLVVNCKNGVSSYEIARDLKVTQKSAWFMLHRIRLALKRWHWSKLGGDGGPIEVDETFIGGKPKNMHASAARMRIGRTAMKADRARPSSWECSTANPPGSRQGDSQCEARDPAERDSESDREAGRTVYTDGCNGYDWLKRKSSSMRP